MKPDFDRWQRSADQEAKIEILEQYFEKHDKYPDKKQLQDLIDQYWEEKRHKLELEREG